MVFVLASDRKMYTYLRVTVNNILKTNPTLENIYCFIEDDWIPIAIDPRVIFVNVNVIPGFNHPWAADNSVFTRMSLVRCFVPQILPAKRAIWLDIDTVILDDCVELWTMDLEENYCAGVRDSGMKNFKDMWGASISTYINSGVLLMDLEKMRQDNISKKMIHFLETKSCSYYDQDAINFICLNRIKLIEAKWNSGPSTEEVENPVIHHGTFLKPWDPMSYYYDIWKLNI